MKEEDSLRSLLSGEMVMCPECEARLKRNGKIIKIGCLPDMDDLQEFSLDLNRKVRTAYVRNEGFESLYERYAGCRDTALASIFLKLAHQEIPWLKRYPCISALPLRDEQGNRTADELGMIFQAAGIPLYYPLETRRGTMDFSREIRILLQDKRSHRNLNASLDDKNKNRRVRSSGRMKPVSGHSAGMLPCTAVCLTMPSREEFLYNPVLLYARQIWILAAEEKTSWICRLTQSLRQKYGRWKEKRGGKTKGKS